MKRCAITDANNTSSMIREEFSKVFGTPGLEGDFVKTKERPSGVQLGRFILSKTRGRGCKEGGRRRAWRKRAGFFFFEVSKGESNDGRERGEGSGREMTSARRGRFGGFRLGPLFQEEKVGIVSNAAAAGAFQAKVFVTTDDWRTESEVSPPSTQSRRYPPFDRKWTCFRKRMGFPRETVVIVHCRADFLSRPITTLVYYPLLLVVWAKNIQKVTPVWNSFHNIFFFFSDLVWTRKKLLVKSWLCSSRCCWTVLHRFYMLRLQNTGAYQISTITKLYRTCSHFQI